MTDIAAGLIGLLFSVDLDMILRTCQQSTLLYTLAELSLPFGVFACNQVAICLLARHRHEQIAQHDKYNHGQKPKRRLVKYFASVCAVTVLFTILARLIDQSYFFYTGRFAIMTYQVRDVLFLYTADSSDLVD